MRLRIACIAVLSCAAACTTDTTGTSYSVGGQVTGLTGSLTLANNATDNVTITGPGAFTFGTLLKQGAAYAVTAVTQPTGETCTVTDGTGTVENGNVTSIKVACATSTATKYTVGGSLTGLTSGAGTVVLKNGTDQVSVTAAGNFVFPTAVATGTGYAVSVNSQPTGWNCSVSNPNGNVNDANITNVGVACAHTSGNTTGGGSTPHYTLGGHLTINAATGSNPGNFVVHNGTDSTTLTATGDYTLSSLLTGTTYHVTATGPAGWACTVTNPNGTVANANVTGIDISCTQKSLKVQGTVTGQTSAFGLVDANTNATIAVTSTATTFEITGYHYGDPFLVTIDTLPTGQGCQVRNGLGKVYEDNITDVIVTCGTPVSLTGDVTGATGDFAVLVNGSNFTWINNGDTSYEVSDLVDDSLYKVTIAAHPNHQRCTVSNDADRFSGNATGVDIHCVSAYEVQGDFSGFVDGLILAVTDGSDYSLVEFIGNVGTDYSLPITAGHDWSVWVLASPRGQSCSIAQPVNRGTAIAADATGVDITCTPRTYSVFGEINFTGTDEITVEDDHSHKQVIDHTGYSFRFSGFAEGATTKLKFTSKAGLTCTTETGISDVTFNKADSSEVKVFCK